MTMERKSDRQFIPVSMPPSRACSVCRNNLNETCVTECAPAKDFKDFDPDMERSFGLVPKLTFQEYMDLPGNMKGKWLFYQQTKILEAINGDELGPPVYRRRSVKIPSAQQKSGLLYDSQEGASSPETE